MIALVEQYIPDKSSYIVEFLLTYFPILLFSIPFLVLIYYLIYKFVKRYKNNINNYWNHDNRQG
mgnify:CR=1 FL=1